jgi:hypothetical protein
MEDNYFDKKYQTYASILESLKKNKEVTIINTLPLLCDEKSCTMEKDGKPTRLALALKAWGASSKEDAQAKARAISGRNRG